jgi:preprotein translocase subunit SecD
MMTLSSEEQQIDNTLESGRIIIKSALITLLQAIVLSLIVIAHILIFGVTLVIGLCTSTYGVLLQSARLLRMLHRYLQTKSELNLTGGRLWV